MSECKPERKILSLALAKIGIDPRTQARERTHPETVARYADVLRAKRELLGPKGDDYPIVFQDGKAYWLADGHHRRLAHIEVHRLTMWVEVLPGTLRDAILWAVSANAMHPLPRSRADERRAVGIVLDLCDAGPWAEPVNNCRVAAQCAVSEHLVRIIRAERTAAPKGSSKGGNSPPSKNGHVPEEEAEEDLEAVEAESLAERAILDRLELLSEVHKCLARCVAPVARLGDAGVSLRLLQAAIRELPRE